MSLQAYKDKKGLSESGTIRSKGLSTKADGWEQNWDEQATIGDSVNRFKKNSNSIKKINISCRDSQKSGPESFGTIVKHEHNRRYKLILEIDFSKGVPVSFSPTRPIIFFLHADWLER